MEMRPWLEWPVYRQLTGPDALAQGAAVIFPITGGLRPRTVPADRVVDAVCRFCALGCGQQVYAGVASPRTPASSWSLSSRDGRTVAVSDSEGRRR